MSRIVYIDVAKVIATFLVVYAHLYSDYSTTRLYVYAFHMPFFFLVSGMLHKFNNTVQWKKYVKTIIYPSLFFLFCFIIVSAPLFYNGIWEIPDYYYCWGGDSLWDVSISVIATTINAFIVSHMFTNTMVWFFVVLFYCKVLLDIVLGLLVKVNGIVNSGKRIVLYAGGMIICLAGFYLLLKISFPMFLNQVIMAFPFYLIGYILKKMHLDSKTVKVYKKLIFVLAFLCLSILITNLNGRVSMHAIIWGNQGILSIPLFYFNGLLGSVMLLLIATCWKFKSRFFEIVSDCMISIVGFQIFFIDIIRYQIGFDNNCVISGLLTLLIISICILMHRLFMRIIPFVYGKDNKEL